MEKPSKKFILLTSFIFYLLGVSLAIFLNILWEVEELSHESKLLYTQEPFFVSLLNSFFPLILFYVIFLSFSPLYLFAFFVSSYLAKEIKRNLILYSLIFVCGILIGLPSLFWDFVVLVFHPFKGKGAALIGILLFPFYLLSCFFIAFIFRKPFSKKIIFIVGIASLVLFLTAISYATIRAKFVLEAAHLFKSLYEKGIENKDLALCEEISRQMELKRAKSYLFHLGRDYYVECMINLARIFKDESYCELCYRRRCLLKEATKCKRDAFLLATHLCQEAPDKQACLEDLAIERDDLDLCYKILGVKCLGGIAAKRNDIGLCERTFEWELGYEDVCFEPHLGNLLGRKCLMSECPTRACFEAFFQFTDRVELCEELSQLFRDDCFYGAAVQLKNPALCEKAGYDLKEICYSKLAVILKSEELCEKADSNTCWGALAILKNNPDLCERIRLEYWKAKELKEKCLHYFGEKLQ